jgi:hypothetical protein
MRLIKSFFLVTGLVILKLTQPLIPAENPNSSNFYGTEGVGKKATLQATRVIHARRKESLFFFANKLDEVLVRITLVV